jgi:hypothetical protein
MAQEGSSLVVPALAAGESPAGLLRAGQQLLLTRTSSASQGFWLELSWAEAQSPPWAHLTEELCLTTGRSTCCSLLHSYDAVASTALSPHSPVWSWDFTPTEAWGPHSHPLTWLPGWASLLTCVFSDLCNGPHICSRNLHYSATPLIQVMFAFLKSIIIVHLFRRRLLFNLVFSPRCSPDRLYIISVVQQREHFISHLWLYLGFYRAVLGKVRGLCVSISHDASCGDLGVWWKLISFSIFNLGSCLGPALRVKAERR